MSSKSIYMGCESQFAIYRNGGSLLIKKFILKAVRKRKADANSPSLFAERVVSNELGSFGGFSVGRLPT